MLEEDAKMPPCLDEFREYAMDGSICGILCRCCFAFAFAFNCCFRTSFSSSSSSFGFRCWCCLFFPALVRNMFIDAQIPMCLWLCSTCAIHMSGLLAGSPCHFIFVGVFDHGVVACNRVCVCVSDVYKDNSMKACGSDTLTMSGAIRHHHPGNCKTDPPPEKIIQCFPHTSQQ